MNNLRPLEFKDIIGNDHIKQCLDISIKSAQNRNDVLNHVLLEGPAGLGKTTFAMAIANRLKSKIYIANGAGLGKLKDVLPYLVRLERGNVLFIDEVHRMSNILQESLFVLMEDFRLDIAKGAKSIDFEPFVLIGATTESGMLLRPFVDRFIHRFTMEYYTIEELSDIIRINCDKLKIIAMDAAIHNLAMRSRFTPRIANSLLQWCRDYALSGPGSNSSRLDSDVVNAACKLKKIDEKGLDSSDRKYIMVLKRARKPLGLNTLVGATGLSRETIENQIEPYLLKLNMIEKTSKGRQIVNKKL